MFGETSEAVDINYRLIFYICGTVHHHLINKDDQRDAACGICLHYACGITLHVSGALCTALERFVPDSGSSPNRPALTPYLKHDCTRIRMYSFYTLLMMGAKSTRNMKSDTTGIMKTNATCCITLVVFINYKLIFPYLYKRPLNKYCLTINVKPPTCTAIYRLLVVGRGWRGMEVESSHS